MRSIIKLTGCLLAVSVLLAFQASAQTTIVYYSFNNTSLLDGTAAGSNAFEAADIGSGISTLTTFLTGTGVKSYPSGNLLNAQPGYPSGNSISWNNFGNSTNRYYQFSLDSTGYSGLILSWAVQRSGNGPRSNELWYSSDGGANFSLFAENEIPVSGVYQAFTNNLSSITALDNNSSVIFRIMPLNVGGAGGTYRIDNFTIDVIPEPSTVLLVGVGLVGLLALRRRRS